MVYVLVVNGAVTAVYSNKNAARSDKQRIEKKIQDLAIVGVPYRTKSVLN
ncbi:hypothetical protein [Lactiplantibacillus plantarum]|nr:hypothetical protein [Lactiplantibacillus plantarum]UWF30265.1 hypothetical protein NYR27_09485 [Lactiplantibacillus plantarum]UWF40295.1 hypothetical protein NYR28_06020 [Lactiplantibacillus plantarum]UWF43294.1 hypothetical protein NYR31_06030 [Lactiplantibacillus plantarum]